MAAPVTSRTSHIIAGEHRDGDGDRIDVVNPATEEVIASVPAGTPGDVDAAVSAAAEAYPAWSATPLADRVRVVRALSDALGERRDEIAATITAEMGSPITFATKVQAALPAITSGNLADLLESGYAFEEKVGNSLVVREPVGVVGAITPWNYPLNQVLNKVAPALAAGNTVVLKPSEVAPLSVGIFAEILEQIGLPPGVFNLVHGLGDVVGGALAAHPRVDMVSFTGSTRAGKLVTKAAADTVKKVALELGGKSANVLLEDADFPTAVKIGIANCYINGGQTCTALTRMLVPRARHDEIVDLAVAAAGKYTVGDPTDEKTRIGPMSSATQRDRVLGYYRTGESEGATVALGGASATGLPERGAYVAPTIFAGVTTDMTIAQEEIFGPALSIMPYDDEEDAARIANDTVYGLAGAVSSADPDRALAFARRLRTGQVEVNGGQFNPAAPFGGYRQSGNGRELGRYGLEEFTELKSIQT